jgi:pimeloyl-ACP methyl ester carboxylesterase
MPSFRYGADEARLAYSVHGEGTRTVVLLPGLLFSKRMHEPLAEALAEHGNRVLCLDVLGHGESDRPGDMWRYSMTEFGRQTVALLDHLGIDEAVVGGTSLGANITLEVCSIAPERVRGAVIEMPVLDNALIGCALAFTPLIAALTFGAPLWRAASAPARLLPQSRLPLLANLMVDWVTQDPGPSGELLQGLFFGRIAPHRDERATFEMPALVLGHPRDPVHPFSDADQLAREMRNARLVDARSFFEMRLSPHRLTEEICSFVDECWKPKPAQDTAAPPHSATA